MTKTALQRVLLASIPAAFIATTTLANAAAAPIVHGLPMRPAFGARPLAAPSMVHRNANSTPRTTFVAGGATLPALAYLGAPALSQNPGLPATGSVFGEFAALTHVTTQYCQTGSGFGKRVFDGDPVSVTGGVNGPCAALGTAPGSTNGFGAPAALGLTDPDITGTDAPLAQSEYTNFVNEKAATRGEPVELPSLIGSVALLYNNPDLTTQISLSDAQICNVVEGKVTNWNQISKSYKSRALFFVYRSDGSGTTFSFSNHLLAACTASGLNTSQNFTNATPPNVSVFPGTLPLNFVGESGNVGVSTEIKSAAGSIGYVEAANAQSAVGGSVAFAKVNGHDPIKDLPQTAAALLYTASTIALDSAVVTTGGPATVAALTGVAKAGCVTLVKPSAYANLKTSTGYSIIAVTNVLFSTKGNGMTNTANLKTFVTELNTPSLFGSSITTVNAPTKTSGTGTTGYAALGASYNAQLIKASKACIGT